MDIQIKRVYEPYSKDDGFRVLVDRLWPRGLTKERVHYDLWAKNLAPSTELRRAFGHKPENWDTFKQHYLAELDQNPAAWNFAHKIAGPEFASYPRITLLYAARDPHLNHALILAQWLREHESSHPASQNDQSESSPSK